MIAVEKVKDARGRVVRFRASLGLFESFGRTATEAKTNLLGLIAAEPSFWPVVMVGPDGGIWTLWKQPGSAYCYRTPSGCFCALATLDATVARMTFESHYAGYYAPSKVGAL